MPDLSFVISVCDEVLVPMLALGY
uniref:Uncharacterized protein n=1 Tax=Arundo donax TaxID=35708 RepID=A0A0A9FD82_ARUDO